MVVYVFETVIRGIKPYLQHHPRCIMKYAEFKKEQGRTAKPPPDVAAKWGVYENKEGPFIPQKHILGAILAIAADTKLQKMRGRAAYDLLRRSVEIVPIEIPLMRDGKRITDYEINMEIARVQSARIERARPMFNLPWEAGLDIRYNFSMASITVDEVKKIVIKSGDVGIGDWRPIYGQYNVDIVKVYEI